MTESCTTVLLIEDNRADADLIQEILSEQTLTHFRLRQADRLRTGLERLAEGGVNVILLDLSLPDSRGLETFQQVQAHSPDVPIVVLTGLDDERVAAETFKAGGQDYLRKGALNYCVISQSIQNAVQRNRASEESRLASQAAIPPDDRSQVALGDQLRAPLTPALATVSALIDEPGSVADLRPALATIRQYLEQELRLIDELLG